MEKKITTLTCLSAMIAAGNAYGSCAPSCGGGRHHTQDSSRNLSDSRPERSHTFQHNGSMDRHEFGPINRPERHERHERHEFRPINRMEHHRFDSIKRMERREIHPIQRRERHESRPVRYAKKGQEFRSVGQRSDFHSKGSQESRHSTKKRHHRDERHETQHHERWKHPPHNKGHCHDTRSCSKHKSHDNKGHHHGKSHRYQFVPAPPNPHWGMGGSYNEWHVIDVGVPYTPQPTPIKIATPKTQPHKPKLVRSAPVRPKYQQVAQVTPNNLCNLRYKYPTISSKKGGFYYETPAKTEQQTASICIKVSCNNAHIT